MAVRHGGTPLVGFIGNGNLSLDLKGNIMNHHGTLYFLVSIVNDGSLDCFYLACWVCFGLFIGENRSING